MGIVMGVRIKKKVLRESGVRLQYKYTLYRTLAKPPFLISSLDFEKVSPSKKIFVLPYEQRTKKFVKSRLRLITN